MISNLRCLRILLLNKKEFDFLLLVASQAVTSRDELTLELSSSATTALADRPQWKPTSSKCRQILPDEPWRGSEDSRNLLLFERAREWLLEDPS